jgi:hypothetical protein
VRALSQSRPRSAPSAAITAGGEPQACDAAHDAVARGEVGLREPQERAELLSEAAQAEQQVQAGGGALRVVGAWEGRGGAGAREYAVGGAQPRPPLRVLAGVDVKDRLGEPERGNEWELIKNFLEGDENSNKTNTASKSRLRLNYPSSPRPCSHWSATSPRNQQLNQSS